MNHKHADYGIAKRELSDIFGTVTGTKSSNSSLKSLLHDWTEKYSSRTLLKSDDEMILVAGGVMSDEYVCILKFIEILTQPMAECSEENLLHSLMKKYERL
jgi:hypothetical protein